MHEPKKIPLSVAMDQARLIMTEDQVEAKLWAALYYFTQKEDRRAEGMHQVDHNTGLPVSANSLTPLHRSKSGVDLLMEVILSPEDLITSVLSTDEIAENIGLPPEKRSWRSLAALPKKQWSREMVHAVKENTRLLKLVIKRHAEHGLFDETPQIDDGSTLGVKNLPLHEDKFTIGFRVTWEGVKFMQRWVELNQDFVHRNKPADWLEALGKYTEAAKSIPDWKKREIEHGGTGLPISV